MALSAISDSVLFKFSFLGIRFRLHTLSPFFGLKLLSLYGSFSCCGCAGAQKARRHGLTEKALTAARQFPSGERLLNIFNHAAGQKRLNKKLCNCKILLTRGSMEF